MNLRTICTFRPGCTRPRSPGVRFVRSCRREGSMPAPGSGRRRPRPPIEDDPRPPPPRDVGPSPFEEHDQAVAVADEPRDVDEEPEEPGRKPRETMAEHDRDRRRAAD